MGFKNTGKSINYELQTPTSRKQCLVGYTINFDAYTQKSF